MPLRPRLLPIPLVLVIPALAGATLSSAAIGQTTDRGRPAAAGRVVASFDFEEQDTNPLPVPQGWIRAQHDPVVPRIRPGFAPWNHAELDYGSPAVSGVGTARLPTKGDSTSLQLLPGVVPVFTTADYLITAMVRTENLDTARAALAVRLLDSTGTVIPGTEQMSPLVRTNGEWKPIATSVEGDVEGAVFLQVELLLLQAKQQPGQEADEYTIWREDIGGVAWFDDVTLIQMPRVDLSTASASNISASGAPPQLNLMVRDLTGQPLTAHLRVVDLGGKLIDEAHFDFTGGRLEQRWTPDYPGFGWYRAMVAVGGPEGSVGGASVDLLWMPPTFDQQPTGTRFSRAGGPSRVTSDRLRFQIEAESLPDPLAAIMPEILFATGAGSLVIPLWSESLTGQDFTERVDALSPVIDRLLSAGSQVTLSLPQTPRALATDLGIDEFDPLGVFLGPKELWEPYLLPALDEFGQAIRRWRVGVPGGSRAFQSANLNESTSALHAALSQLVPGPIIEIPWRADLSFDPGRLGSAPEDTALSLAVPAGMTPQMIADALSEALVDTSWNGSSGPRRLNRVTAILEIETDRVISRRESVDLFTRRGIEVWRAATSSHSEDRVALAVSDPWSIEMSRDLSLRPAPELAAFRTLSDQLVERVFVTEYTPYPGLRGLVFAPGPNAPLGRGGMMVVWSEDPSVTTLEATLGAGPVRVTDPLGNIRVVEPTLTAGTDRRFHEIEVGPGPLFIEGIDTELIRFLAAVRIDDPFLPATISNHDRSILLENPWPVPVRGRALIVEPTGFSDQNEGIAAWRLGPRISAFTIPPNGSTRVPFAAAFPAIEIAGTKRFVIDFELRAQRTYPWSRTTVPVEIGSRRAAMTIDHRYVRNADGRLGIVVETRVRNLSEDLLSVEIAATGEGVLRQRASVSDLTPGSEIVRTFAYADAEEMRGRRLVVSLFERATNTRLNQVLEIQ